MALFITHCATYTDTPSRAVATRADLLRQPNFHLRGRFKLITAEQRSSARFLWHHQPQKEEILVLSPIGTTAARLTINMTSAVLEADNKKYSFTTAAAMAEDFFGVNLPLDAMARWMEGEVSSAQRVERDGIGRPLRAYMDSWQVEYLTYATPALDALPTSLQIKKDGVDLLLLFDQWVAEDGDVAQ